MTTYKLAIDTGGTFTDFCLMSSDGTVHVAKTPSTPDNPARAVLTGTWKIMEKAGVKPQQISLLLHGTTVATNAILEHKGATIALLTTRGFRDIIFIGRQNRPDLYNFRAVKPPPLLPRNLVFEVKERILADGTVDLALDQEELARLVEVVKEARVSSVAICLLHSYINQEHELRLKDALLKALPHLAISVSCEILPEMREYERTSTTVINAFIQPLVAGYLQNLAEELNKPGLAGELFVMQSAGGVISASEACRQSAHIVLSGPAGAVLAGLRLGENTPHKNLLTADMGGTSMDVCLINQGKASFTTEGTVGGYPLRLPMLDIATIGAGGGSIAWVDPGGALRVGPRSAGALPGPACYDQGGEEPTVTDANVFLGRLSPADLAGTNQIKPELSALAISKYICAPLSLSLEEAAEGIIRVVNANMVRAMRKMSIAKGHDPRLFTLAPFGGAAPLHAVELAKELDMPRVLIAPYPGIASAWGMLSADIRHDFSATNLLDFVPEVCPRINSTFEELIAQGREVLSREGFNPEEIKFQRLLDLRYRGQSYELTLTVPANPLLPTDMKIIQRRFHLKHNQLYGYSRENAPVQLVAQRLTALGALPKETPYSPPTTSVKEIEPLEHRRVYLAGSYYNIPVYSRAHIRPGIVIDGPAVITQEDTTTLLWPGNQGSCDRWGNIIIDRKAELYEY